jgi:hypothetical protein
VLEVQQHLPHREYGQLLHIANCFDLASKPWNICKKILCMVLPQIVLTKEDFKKEPDGFIQMVICEFADMKAFGWNNNNQLTLCLMLIPQSQEQ